MKSSGNLAESTFAVLKRNLARLNRKSRTETASLNMLSAAWVSKHCGLQGVVDALRLYGEEAKGRVRPQLASKETEWLEPLESAE